MRNISELIQRAWPLSVFGEKESDKPELKEKIKNLLKQQNAVIIAHYYTRPSVQELAEETGGIVADSLDMAKFGKNREFKKLIIAGVKFMAETAKILSPEKKVFIPNERATCSLDLGCDYEDFSKFIESYKDKEVVVYANTSAKIKSLASWVVTSSNAVSIVNHLKEKGREIIWAPDKNLGSYIKEKTHAKMIIWDGSCLVHEEFDAGAIKKMLTDTSVACLVHPESSKEVLALADVVGSTSELLKASIKMPQTKFIVATDKGVIYQMKKASDAIMQVNILEFWMYNEVIVA